jgi:hypothetical protein
MYVLIYYKFLEGELDKFTFNTDPTNPNHKDYIELIRSNKKVKMKCYISGCELKRSFEKRTFVKNYPYFTDLVLLLQETTGIIVTYNRSKLSPDNLTWL